jgi:hypothetical protein
MPLSASLGPNGAQIPGSTGVFREEVDEEKTCELARFSIYVELVFDLNKDQIMNINTFQRLCFFSFFKAGGTLVKAVVNKSSSDRSSLCDA